MEQQLGKYRLVRRLATGGMAEVFLAKAAGPMGFEKELVVKRILPHLAEDPQFVEMFLAEAKLAARLNHGNVVQIFDFGEQEDSYFIAMEYVEGLNLKVLLKRTLQQGKPLPFPLIARIVSLACEGLAYAHELVDPDSGQPMKFIHRDISTDNILVSLTGGVKVVDFGIAKAATVGSQTQSGIIKGKLPYMPPEYLMASPIDLRSDIYALGVVLYELIAGRRPFVAETDVLLAQLIIHGLPTDLRSLREGVPTRLVQVLEKAMHKNRDERYATCRQMQADLERFLFECGEPVGALQIAEWVKAMAAVEPPPTRRNSRELPVLASPTESMAKPATRPLRAPTTEESSARRQDTIITQSMSPGDEEDDAELARLVTRPRWPKAVGLTAGVLLLAAVLFSLFSHEPAPDAAQAEAPAADAHQAPAVPAATPPPEALRQNDSTGQQPTKAPQAVIPAVPTGEPPSPESPTANTSRLKVVSNPEGELWINEKERGMTPFDRPVPPGKKSIEVIGTHDGHRFNKVQVIQIKEGESRKVSFAFKKSRVQVWANPGMKVLKLDGHPLGKDGWIETYEGWHTLEAVDAVTGKPIPAECKAVAKSRECKASSSFK
ncbi:serine/threonine protein kinase [Hyalangium minutum]|uniref:Serine/threonine-protein kinase Pkn6 n=1 Tax=Hyalangium minutum TaxID=394096 RepID=A0A085WG87_9BACT|nr:serine/threonine-protein kinase [Hyalangium minutum]KFE66700.1 Serine/threonine-protein kinase Pkn6 [Hyalangium minutum]